MGRQRRDLGLRGQQTSGDSVGGRSSDVAAGAVSLFRRVGEKMQLDSGARRRDEPRNLDLAEHVQQHVELLPFQLDLEWERGVPRAGFSFVFERPQALHKQLRLQCCWTNQSKRVPNLCDVRHHFAL
uniref:(northern house mosquito) hypothetical protein n=1 Tax=Culex pipiens TaxID=7175 RepID=A0A8D8C012_CULPI